MILSDPHWTSSSLQTEVVWVGGWEHATNQWNWALTELTEHPCNRHVWLLSCFQIWRHITHSITSYITLSTTNRITHCIINYQSHALNNRRKNRKTARLFIYYLRFFIFLSSLIKIYFPSMPVVSNLHFFIILNRIEINNASAIYTRERFFLFHLQIRDCRRTITYFKDNVWISDNII